MPSRKNYRIRTRKIRTRKIKGGASYFEPFTKYLSITSGTNETISKMKNDKDLLNDQMTQLTKTYNNIVANVYQLESRINGITDVHEKCTSLHPEISSSKSNNGIFSFFNPEKKNSEVENKTTTVYPDENTTELTKPYENAEEKIGEHESIEPPLSQQNPFGQQMSPLSQENAFGESQENTFGESHENTVGESQENTFGESQENTFGESHENTVGESEGEQKPFGESQEKPFGESEGEQKPFGESQEKPFGESQENTFGQQKPFGEHVSPLSQEKPFGESEGEQNTFGEQQTYINKEPDMSKETYASQDSESENKALKFPIGGKYYSRKYKKRTKRFSRKH
jgi:hypothetical protein